MVGYLISLSSVLILQSVASLDAEDTVGTKAVLSIVINGVAHGIANVEASALVPISYRDSQSGSPSCKSVP
jgi:hypothetical protein